MGMLQLIDSLIGAVSFKERISGLLMELCAIDTSMRSDSAAMCGMEKRLFDRIEVELEGLRLGNATIQKKSISSEIEKHSAFTPVHYVQADGRTTGSTASVYKNRTNMVLLLDNPPSKTGRNTAVNVHIDTVPPFFPPRRERDVVYGRGSADDKGNIAALFGALRLLNELNTRKIISLRNKLTVMFVIEEESGGNGSLDLAMDRNLKTRYESLLVLECTNNRIHPANRGAVFFKCSVGHGVKAAPATDTATSLEVMIPVILSILDEGERIKAESDHPLFPHRPVQTCTGILGQFGEHPSTICAMVQCRLKNLSGAADIETVSAVVRRGVDCYIARYGDKTRVVDRDTGMNKLDRHYRCAFGDDGALIITVYGSTGHMGSLPENDAAITKLAFIGRELLGERETGNFDFSLELVGHDGTRPLIFEGAQGFLPTHSVEEVKDRLWQAFAAGLKTAKGAGNRGASRERGDESVVGSISFEKLHNDAYACDPLSDTVRCALRAAEMTGIPDRSDPLRGWDVSCDARLFAHEYRTLPVVTFGAGKLEHAHSDGERVHLPELLTAVKFLTLFILLETGTAVSA
jgi:acetylornithine deacetylase/succinyl-diaminopimelate desuccinylase-like protein